MFVWVFDLVIFKVKVNQQIKLSIKKWWESNFVPISKFECLKENWVKFLCHSLRVFLLFARLTSISTELFHLRSWLHQNMFIYTNLVHTTAGVFFVYMSIFQASNSQPNFNSNQNGIESMTWNYDNKVFYTKMFSSFLLQSQTNTQFSLEWIVYVD